MLCAGCPHRGVFIALRKLKAYVTRDIGCYALGALPPLASLHTCLCMGAGIGQVHGMQKVRGTDARAVAAPGELSWQQQPALGRTPVAVVQPGQFGRWLEFDITSLINEWLSGRTANYGVCVRVPNESDRPAMHCEYQFVAREFVDASLRPQLSLEI